MPLFRLLISIFALGAGLLCPVEAASSPLAQAQKHDTALEAEKALALYLVAEKSDPANPVILVGISRQYRHLMADASSEAEKRRLAGQALLYDAKAAAAGPNDSDARLSIAITYGKMIPFQSAKEQIETGRQIKAAAETALRLNPKNDLAWHILGRWHMVYADLRPVRRALGELLYGKLPQSTYAEAAKCFERAVKANPDRLMHQIELGSTYAKMGRTAEARQLIRKGLSMPNVGKDDPDFKTRGREILASLPDSEPPK